MVSHARAVRSDFAPRSPLRRIGLVAQEPDELAQSCGLGIA